MIDINRRQFAYSALAIAATAGIQPLPAAAQARSPGVLTLVVPQAPGGAVDQIARALSEHFVKDGVPSIVVNKPGAAGEIAAAFVLAAPADGSTILVGNSSTMVVSPQVKKTRYDPVKDFRSLGGVVVADTVMVASKASGLKSLDDVVRYARSRPGELAYASNGVGGAFHLAMEYFQSLTGTKMLHVPFNGATLGEMALLSSQVGLMITNTSSILPHVKSGNMQAIAAISSTPSIELPDLVLASTVIPNLVANTWVGVYAPAGIAEGRARELNAQLDQFLKAPGGQQFFRSKGFIPVPGNLDDASAWTRKELQAWGAIVRAAEKNGPIQ